MTKFTNNNDKAKSTFCRKNSGIKGLYILGFMILCLMAFAPVVEASCSCNAGNWDPSAFLNSDVPGIQSATTSAGTSTASNGNDVQPVSLQTAPHTVPRSDLFPNGQIIKPLKSVSSSDLVVDVSNDNSYSQSHIKGAILVPSKSFLNDDGTLKPILELAKILGNAGVSHNDSVVIYSDKLEEATFVFWTMRYLGQENVKVLDGSIEDWKTAGLPIDSIQSTRPAVEYTPSLKSEILADYDYVKTNSAQIVDARPFTEFSNGHIPFATPLDPAKILMNGKFKNSEDLADVLGNLVKDKPTVVYSSDYGRASLLWYALQLMGYDTKIYTWQDWAAHQPTSEKKDTVASGKENTNTSRFKKLGTT